MTVVKVWLKPSYIVNSIVLLDWNEDNVLLTGKKLEPLLIHIVIRFVYIIRLHLDNVVVGPMPHVCRGIRSIRCV